MLLHMYRKYFLKSSQPRLVTNLDVVNRDVESIFFRSTGSYKTKAANKSNSTFLFRTDTRHMHTFGCTSLTCSKFSSQDFLLTGRNLTHRCWYWTDTCFLTFFLYPTHNELERTLWTWALFLIPPCQLWILQSFSGLHKKLWWGLYFTPCCFMTFFSLSDFLMISPYI